MKVLGTGFLSLLEDIRPYELLLLLSYYFDSNAYHRMYGYVLYASV